MHIRIYKKYHFTAFYQLRIRKSTKLNTIVSLFRQREIIANPECLNNYTLQTPRPAMNGSL